MIYRLSYPTERDTGLPTSGVVADTNYEGRSAMRKPEEA